MQLPEKLLKSLEGVHGFDREQLVAAHQIPAVTSVRLHPEKGSGVFLDKAHVKWCADGRYLEERPVFTLDPLYHAGAYYVQEASSMFLDYALRQLLPDRNNLRVLDLCAAPGGKSTLIASLLGKDSLLVSNEVIRTRASILEENMTRWGYMNTWVTSNDARDIGKLSGYFDVIVVDAPCSGSGLFRKDARALDEWSEDNVALCAQRQQRILADVWPALKEGGLLIYATCSYSPQEDEEILDWLAEDMGAESVSIPLANDWGIVSTISEKKGCKGYRFFPGKISGEGFFLAAMRKTQEQKQMKPVKFKSVNDVRAKALASGLLASDDWSCVKGKDDYFAISDVHEQDYHLLNNSLYLRKTGLNLGVPVKNDWLPAHDSALSIDRSPDLSAVDVDKEQALKFLKKEDPGLTDLPKGWYIVSYSGRGLGWIKSIGNRVNNYLPKHWRIRMELPDADWE